MMAAIGSLSNAQRDNSIRHTVEEEGESEVDSWLIDPRRWRNSGESLEAVSNLQGSSKPETLQTEILYEDIKVEVREEESREMSDAEIENLWAKTEPSRISEIWKTTLFYLHAASECLSIDLQTDPSSVSEVISTINSLFAPPPPQSPVSSTEDSVQSADACFSTDDSASSQTDLKPEGEVFVSKPKRSSRKSKRGKTGRKPNPCRCFLCFVTLPYKRNLIAHLKGSHGIERSQSLMYKRINQGEEEMKRLYVAPLRIFRGNRVDK